MSIQLSGMMSRLPSASADPSVATSLVWSEVVSVPDPLISRVGVPLGVDQAVSPLFRSTQVISRSSKWSVSTFVMTSNPSVPLTVIELLFRDPEGLE